MTLVETRRHCNFADPDFIRKAVNTRIINNIIRETPAKPDPDVIALCSVFFIEYDRARVLKALSYGMPCDTELLAWAAGVSSNTTFRYRSVTVHRHVQALKQHRAGISIEKIIRRTFIITDQSTLQAIKLAMDAPPP